MEVLIVLVAEFLLAPLIAAISSVIGLIGTILGILFELALVLVSLCRSKSSKEKIPRQTQQAPHHAASGPDHAVPPQTPSWRGARPQGTKWVERTLVAGSAIVLLVLLAINFLFLQTAANWVFARIESRTGIEISAADVTGNLFTGRFNMVDVVTSRNSTDKSSFDLQAANLAVDIDMASLLLGPATLQSLTINDVSGRFEYRKRANRKIRTRRVFRIDDLAIRNAALQLINADNEALDLSLTRVASAPLRSDYAVYDLFFRSDVSGTLAGRRIEISTLKTDDSRSTKWQFDRLPVTALGHFSTNPLLSGLQEGTLDVDVTNSWNSPDRKEFNIDWRIMMHGVKMRVPEDATLKQKAALIPAAKYLDLRKKPIDLSFSMKMDEGRFERTASLDAANFWRAVRGYLVDAFVLKIKAKESSTVQAETKSDAPPEDKPGVVKDAIKRFKGLLNDRGTKPESSE